MSHITKSIFLSYQVGIVDQEIILKAISIAGKYRYSYWDGLILASALVSNCKYIYTEDMQHNQFIENRLQIVNPFVV